MDETKKNEIADGILKLVANSPSARNQLGRLTTRGAMTATPFLTESKIIDFCRLHSVLSFELDRNLFTSGADLNQRVPNPSCIPDESTRKETVRGILETLKSQECLTVKEARNNRKTDEYHLTAEGARRIKDPDMEKAINGIGMPRLQPLYLTGIGRRLGKPKDGPTR